MLRSLFPVAVLALVVALVPLLWSTPASSTLIIDVEKDDYIWAISDHLWDICRAAKHDKSACGELQEIFEDRFERSARTMADSINVTTKMIRKNLADPHFSMQLEVLLHALVNWMFETNARYQVDLADEIQQMFIGFWLKLYVGDKQGVGKLGKLAPYVPADVYQKLAMASQPSTEVHDDDEDDDDEGTEQVELQQEPKAEKKADVKTAAAPEEASPPVKDEL